MRIHIGCELRFEFAQTTPMIVMLNVHTSPASPNWSVQII